MPTNAAFGATTPSIRWASFASAASASGKSSGSFIGGVEPGLQDDLGGDSIPLSASIAAAATARAQRALRNLGRPALVDERHRELEPRTDLACEAPCARSHRVRRAVGMYGQADDQLGRTPFFDQRRDRVEPLRRAR